MQPCAEITLYHGEHAVTLRASLKAALALARMGGGFPALLAQVDSQHHSTLCAIIRACATDRREADRYLHALSDQPLHGFVSEAQTAAYQLIAGVLPGASDDTDTPAKADKGEPKPWPEHFADLYRFGTGWLGWTPDAVWAASPEELTEAFAAHADRLIAMNGGDRDDEDPAPADAARQAQRDQNIADGLDPDFDRGALRSLKMRM